MEMTGQPPSSLVMDKLPEQVLSKSVMVAWPSLTV
jgi:hypothetical protein